MIPIIQWTNVSGVGTWSIDTSARAGQPHPAIRVELPYGLNTMILGIQTRGEGELAFWYRPDPEMTDAFIFTRATK